VVNRRQRIVFGVGATLAGLLMFVVASSFIVARGYPHWLAAAVGAFAFPVAPVAWHVFGERARRKKVAAAKIPPKASLSGGDRFVLRLVVVAVVVLGPIIAIGKLGVVRAVWHHGLWFWPTSYEPSVAHGSALSLIGSGLPRSIDVIGTPLARVPTDAEFAASAHDRDGEYKGVLALAEHELLVAAEGSNVSEPEWLTVAELNKQRTKVPWFALDEVFEIQDTKSLYIAATQAWRYRVDPPGIGPSADLVRELGRAPAEAYAVAAFVPRTVREALPLRTAAAWLLKNGDKFVIEGRVEANDEAAAKRLVAAAQRQLVRAVDDAPQSCREQLGSVVRAIHLDQNAAIITGRLEINSDALYRASMCLIKDR
jgi:hypothetical protein